jgi:phage shock protein A
MLRFIRRLWKYLGTKLNVWHDKTADPEVQLEQAVRESRAQHGRLVEQAAAVIGNQKHCESTLERTLVEYEKVNGLARQALLIAHQETRAGHADRAASFNAAAESYAGRLLALEQQVGEQRQMLLQATATAEKAKTAVTENAAELRKIMERKDAMLSQLDHAKLQEAMNASVARMTSTLGDHVPTVAEVQRKIDARLAFALGRSELPELQAAAAVDPHTVEVEQAMLSAARQDRLARVRADLGLPKVAAPQALPPAHWD